MSYVHYKIRYNNKDEYVKLKDSYESRVEQLISYCVSKSYDLEKVVVLETTNKVIYKSLLSM